jgi:hypothetical protein
MSYLSPGNIPNGNVLQLPSSNNSSLLHNSNFEFLASTAINNLLLQSNIANTNNLNQPSNNSNLSHIILQLLIHAQIQLLTFLITNGSSNNNNPDNANNYAPSNPTINNSPPPKFTIRLLTDVIHSPSSISSTKKTNNYTNLIASNVSNNKSSVSILAREKSLVAKTLTIDTNEHNLETSEQSSCINPNHNTSNNHNNNNNNISNNHESNTINPISPSSSSFPCIIAAPTEKSLSGPALEKYSICNNSIVSDESKIIQQPPTSNQSFDLNLSTTQNNQNYSYTCYNSIPYPATNIVLFNLEEQSSVDIKSAPEKSVVAKTLKYSTEDHNCDIKENDDNKKLQSSPTIVSPPLNPSPIEVTIPDTNTILYNHIGDDICELIIDNGRSLPSSFQLFSPSSCLISQKHHQISSVEAQTLNTTSLVSIAPEQSTDSSLILQEEVIRTPSLQSNSLASTSAATTTECLNADSLSNPDGPDCPTAQKKKKKKKDKPCNPPGVNIEKFRFLRKFMFYTGMRYEPINPSTWCMVKAEADRIYGPAG